MFRQQSRPSSRNSASGSKIRPGDTVAITCGSRRIANYPAIIAAIVDHFKQLRANPFLVPAMGSHGSGTAEGQRELLHGLGITEEIVGAEDSVLDGNRDHRPDAGRSVRLL